MIYTKNYFGKETIDEISYEDVVNFFSEEQQESDKIEFKSFIVSDKSDRKGDSLKDKENGVIKSISGFLNSEGGMLIWGSPAGEIVEGKKEKVFKGQLSLVEQLYEKDQFISKLTDSITPIQEEFYSIGLSMKENIYICLKLRRVNIHLINLIIGFT